jgi:hypothetical protein
MSKWTRDVEFSGDENNNGDGGFFAFVQATRLNDY